MARTPRLSASEVEKKRKTKSTRILLTGGTGFLGSHIAASLLADGYQLALLARPKRQASASARIDKLLDWHGVNSALRKNARVIEGRIDEPNLGLDAGKYSDLLRNIDEIVHCASDTSFAERKRANVEAVNVAGLENVFDFAVQSGCFFFHLISTAFVAGKVTGSCPEAFVNPCEFINVYEETKCRAEWTAREHASKAGIRLSVYRPSIVYGHSETGRSLLFNALYYPVRTALFLKNLYEADIREREGRKAAEMGITIEPDGSTYMPIRMEVNSRGGINLVPVNYFAEAFRAIMEEALEGGIFHIVNSRLKKIEEIIEFAKRLFRMKGIEPCSAEDFERAPKNALETLFAAYLEAYSPYIKDERIFETEYSGPILRRKGFSCPEFDFEIFSRCMNYAVEVGWGSKKQG